MEGLISGFLVLADPYLLALLVMATLGGVVIGALPGLNATTGAVMPLVIFLLFDQIFEIRFPRGLLTNLWYG